MTNYIPANGHTIGAELEAGPDGIVGFTSCEPPRARASSRGTSWRCSSSDGASSTHHPTSKRCLRRTGSGAAERHDAAHGAPPVRIAAPGTGETFDAQLEEDGFHMLWLIHRKRRNSGRVRICYRLPSRPGGASRACHPRSRHCCQRTGSGAEGAVVGGMVPDAEQRQHRRS